MPAPTYVYRAHVAKVLDGDFLDLRVDLGFGISVSVRMRVAGLLDGTDVEGTRFTTKWVEATKYVTIRSRGRGPLGERMADVYDDTNVSLAAELVTANHASEEPRVSVEGLQKHSPPSDRRATRT